MASIAKQIIKTGDGVTGIPYRALYEAYMASPQWAERRRLFFAKYGKKCKGCGGKNEIQLHHRSYANFTVERDDDMVALCTTCHQWVHLLHRTSNKFSLWQATQVVLDMQNVKTSASKRPTLPPAGKQGSSMDAAFSRVRGRQKANIRANMTKNRPR